VAVRLVALLRPLWSYPGRRRRRAEAAALLPTILPSIVPLPDAPSPATWVAHALTPTVSDVTVLALGPRRCPPIAVLKLPRTDAATLSLRRQNSVLAGLHADPRLDEWRRLLPVLLTGGEVDGQPYVVEQMLPERDARHTLRGPRARTRMQAAAAAAIGELHRRTAATVVVEGTTLEHWVDAPVLLVRRVAALHPGAAGHEEALERLALELRAALAGRRLCVATVHGDFTPGNILVTPDGATVTGIVDWTEAAVDDVPLLDLVMLLLSTRTHVQRRELGAVVGTLLQGTPWTRDEQALIDAAQAALPGEPVGHRALVLLCWLRHVAANLTKADRYAGHRVWMARNVWVVLHRL
jgi:aminoglycoside phosphotransferase (APT) family kinase protein